MGCKVHQVPLSAFLPTGQQSDASPGVNGPQIEVPLSGDLGERVPV